ncbi:hypothetical protein EGY07_06610 [Chryseobacterium indologenes]|uniref:Uncharacterized protein n=1 Tax=Chryseobacterium indologenes TaxID=253 RepID=A0A5R9PU87_CHRID|nr:hypothetical protein [Chryseobacterium indologenes]ASE61788.1 hypothetical protein CEQ15_09955 [Chryseobacterium indologenes]ATN05745.1 hypothetical protein CRN76_10210 [Chryseobacterium indologenes]AYZ35265.1 hypothetical protein EGY07_06610 [Chryseobacterium indologenes]AZB17396.1 hypothetical protein EG352_06250 [Chryseobacterium indologenes]MBF6644000.1 hypothetical protein [Chryseobacterium indologenes]
MIIFLKKYYIYIIVIIIGAIIFYDHLFLQKFKNSYKQDGLYTTGTIQKVKGYGRGTGFKFIYTFDLNGKSYESNCDIGNLSYSVAEKKVNKKYLVIYLNSNVHNNRLYANVPVTDSTLKTNDELKKWIEKNPPIKQKLDSIPGAGFFWENYF